MIRETYAYETGEKANRILYFSAVVTWAAGKRKTLHALFIEAAFGNPES